MTPLQTSELIRVDSVLSSGDEKREARILESLLQYSSASIIVRIAPKPDLGSVCATILHSREGHFRIVSHPRVKKAGI